jgi:nitrite reductase (NADH) small subunit
MTSAIPNSASPSTPITPATAEWIDICALDDLPYEAGIGAILPIDGHDQQIALFRLEDSAQVYAIGNFDPFSKANVLARGIIGSIGDKIVVASPILKQHFSLTTGCCIEDAAVSVPTYPVKIVGERVWVACRATAGESP